MIERIIGLDFLFPFFVLLVFCWVAWRWGPSFA